MKFSQYAEPTTSNYLYVDPQNTVHFFMPLIKGGGSAEHLIGTDNTCQAVVAMKDFFADNNPGSPNTNGGIYTLTQYKEHLLDDIALNLSPKITKQKQERLAQIEAYLEALTTIQANRNNTDSLSSSLPRYPLWAEPFLNNRTNLLSMRLRPTDKDYHLRFTRPVFSVDRETSPFFNTMQVGYRNLTIKKQSPKKVLAEETVNTLKQDEWNFVGLQNALKAKTTELYDVTIDFTYATQEIAERVGGRIETRFHRKAATQEYFDQILCITEGTPIDKNLMMEYATGLINFCAKDHWKTLFTPPFFIDSDHEAPSKLIVLTQFFLAEVNIYCYANTKSSRDFGAILDSDIQLSNEVVRIVKTNLAEGKSVERALFDFINTNYRMFGLAAQLNDDDFKEINTDFVNDYNINKQALHFDEFLILVNKAGVARNHQGNICIPFADVISSKFPLLDNHHFRSARRQQLAHVVPHKGKSVNEVDDAVVYIELIDLVSNGDITRAADLLMATLENQQFVFEKLDMETKIALISSPNWERVNAKVETSLRDEASLEKYHANLSYYRLTTSQIACLYYKAFAEMYDPTQFFKFTLQDLQDLLGNYLEGELSVQRTAEGITLFFPASQKAQLTALLKNTENRLYCTEHMVKRLYNEAVRRHGPTSEAINRINAISDPYLQLDGILRQLEIGFEEIFTSLDNSTVVIKTTSSFGIDKFLNILHQKPKFDAAVKTLEKHAQELGNTENREASQAATALVAKLKQHGEDYFINNNIDYPTFRTLCLTSIESKREVLETHHGWKAILAGFLKVINTLIYPLTLFNNNTFFKMTPTDSVRKVEAFNEELETVFNQEHTFGA